MTTFATNMKKYRLQKKLTQEQVADILHVNPQTVSRWECGNTLPDVLILPEIAHLYAVTVDDLFRTSNNSYRNYADRLASIYEKTKSVDDFYSAAVEFRKLIKTGNIDIWDKWGYANLLDEMREYCTTEALKWYDSAIAEGDEADPYVYGRARALRAGLLIDIGKGEALIKEQEKIISKNENNIIELSFLLDLYCRVENYEAVLKLYDKAEAKHMVDWQIYYYAAQAKCFTGKYEEALELYEKCGELGTDFHDEIEGIAICYEKMGNKEAAYKKYMDMAKILHEEGYDEDSLIYEKQAIEVLERNDI